jgi:tetratricopeptide (TPR) repeat protein
MRPYTDEQIWHERQEVIAEQLVAQREVLALMREIAVSDESVEARADLGRAAQRLANMMRLSGQEFNEADELYEQAWAIWQELGRRSASWLVSLQRAELLARLGDEAGCGDRLERLGAALEEEEGLGVYRPVLAAARARWLCRAGRMGEALVCLDEALASVEKARMRGHVEELRGQVARALEGGG